MITLLCFRLYHSLDLSCGVLLKILHAPQLVFIPCALLNLEGVMEDKRQLALLQGDHLEKQNSETLSQRGKLTECDFFECNQIAGQHLHVNGKLQDQYSSQPVQRVHIIRIIIGFGKTCTDERWNRWNGNKKFPWCWNRSAVLGWVSVSCVWAWHDSQHMCVFVKRQNADNFSQK